MKRREEREREEGRGKTEGGREENSDSYLLVEAVKQVTTVSNLRPQAICLLLHVRIVALFDGYQRLAVGSEVLL